MATGSEVEGIVSDKAIKIAVGVLVVTVTAAVWYLGLKEVVLGILYFVATIGQ